MLIPAAIHSSTSHTVMRSPRTQGCPDRLPASIVVRFSAFIAASILTPVPHPAHPRFFRPARQNELTANHRNSTAKNPYRARW